MKKLPLSRNIELFRWGPIPGKYFNAAGELLDSFFIHVPQLYDGYFWPNTLFLVKDGRMVWLTEFPAMWKEGQRIFFNYILPEQKRRALLDKWRANVQRLIGMEQHIADTNLQKLSDEELIDLVKRFYRILIPYWNPTLLPELGNYGAEKYLHDALLKHLGNKEETLKVLEVITAPEELSFYQQEEVDLLHATDVRKHQERYFWLQNSHNGTKVLPVKYFAERKATLSPDFEHQLMQNLAKTKRHKEQLLKQEIITRELLHIGRAMAQSIVWQDQRKMHTFISLYYKYLILQEIAHRTGVLESDLFNIDLMQHVTLLEGSLSKDEVVAKREGVGAWCHDGVVEYLSSDQVQQYWDLYAEEKVTIGNTNAVKGVVASKGTGIVQGKVQILLDPMMPFEEGAVLITTMTSPEYIFAMRKAVAIVTDAGGIGSHAAIVSRELNIPCIVGTKIATKVFKDGDLVEVDADKGIVRKVQAHVKA